MRLDRLEPLAPQRQASNQKAGKLQPNTKSKADEAPTVGQPIMAAAAFQAASSGRFFNGAVTCFVETGRL
jgi:hypothetical protein